MKIAADPDIDATERDRALAEVLPELGFRMPTDSQDLIALLEEELIKEYSDGLISGMALIQRCYEFWRLSEYSPRFRLWHDLGEDIRLSEEGYGPIFYDLRMDDLEGGILTVLRKEHRVPT
ncbi:hypothetical protein DB347_20285 [Opitutaceae bacterium EW11]|nr:hypothetical protein DB347_20285 [Opitutaceae bacterium EW11]